MPAIFKLNLRRPGLALTRSAFLAILLAVLLLGGRARAAEGLYDGFQASGDIRRFAGETLYFDIRFLLFNQAATAEVRFFEKDGGYRARLVAQTKGFVGLLTAYRQHIYETAFEVVDGGNRVRAKSFLRQVINGEHRERTEHTFDYTERRHRWTEFVNGKKTRTDEEPIPEGVAFDDVLTAFYNFRNGVYGPVRPGANYSIHTVPEKGHDTIEINVHPEQEAGRERLAANRASADELLIDILVPKEIFNTETGRIRLLGSRHLIPVESIIEDYILLGDLHATFNRREMVKPASAAPTAANPDNSASPG